MSDFNRNPAVRGGFGADGAAVIDAGLRAYMIRVYKYMAMRLALTGAVAWLTFNAAVTTNAAGALALTPFGQTIYGGMGMILLVIATLGLVFFISFRIQTLQPSTAFALFMV